MLDCFRCSKSKKEEEQSQRSNSKTAVSDGKRIGEKSDKVATSSLSNGSIHRYNGAVTVVRRLLKGSCLVFTRVK